MIVKDCDNCTGRSIENCMCCYLEVLNAAQPKIPCVSGKIEGNFRPTCNYSCALENGCPIQTENRWIKVKVK